MGFLPSSTDQFQLWTPDPGDYRSGWSGTYVFFQRQGNLVFCTGILTYSGADWFSPDTTALDLPPTMTPVAGVGAGPLPPAPSGLGEVYYPIVTRDGFGNGSLYTIVLDGNNLGPAAPMDPTFVNFSFAGTYLLDALF